MKSKYDIFVSYRRYDECGNVSGRDQAHLIANQLESEGYRTFFDYIAIEDNEFDKRINSVLRSCKIFILVLTKDALNRCVNEGDWVRQEIECAIRLGLKIINVSPDNAFNGWPDTLPKSLSPIKNIHISDIHFDSLFDSSIKKLVDDRISSIVQSHKPKQPVNSLRLQFNNLMLNLYLLIIKYIGTIGPGQNVDNEYFLEIQNLVRKLYSIFELTKNHNKELSQKSKYIVDHYNMFIDSLRNQFSADRESEEFEYYAAKSSESFTKFKDAVIKMIDISAVKSLL